MCDALRELFADELEAREAEGEAKGKAEGVLELLGDLGAIPEELKRIIFAQNKCDVLNAWLKLAARASSVEEFMEKIG